jgi:acetaldehyde dehydrogenase
MRTGRPWLNKRRARPAAIIGSGNIGTDLMIKILRHGRHIEMGAMVGIDPSSDGLARAERMGVATTPRASRAWPGHAGVRRHRHRVRRDLGPAHVVNDAFLRSLQARHPHGRPHAGRHRPLLRAGGQPGRPPGAPNINMVTCGGQATIPMVHAVSRTAPVRYAEIVARSPAKAPGPGTRANIDEFTETTSRAIEQVGGAKKGKAIIVLNPAEPPLVMRDTVYTLCGGGRRPRGRNRWSAWWPRCSPTCPATASSRRCSSNA